MGTTTAEVASSVGPARGTSYLLAGISKSCSWTIDTLGDWPTGRLWKAMGKQTLAALRLILGPLVTLFSHDLVQTGRLASAALVGLVVIGLWGLYGDLLLSNLVVVAVIDVLIVCYAGSLMVLTGRLVRSQDRWQVESTLTLRELLSEGTPVGPAVQGGSPFYARQLRLRLEEEVRRCKEYGTPLTVVAVRLELPGQVPSHAIFSQANLDMADLVTSHREALHCPTPLGMFEYAFYLPNSGRPAAQAMTTFIAGSLRRYRCSFGLAVFPDDGEDGDTLLRHAIEQCGMLRTSAA